MALAGVVAAVPTTVEVIVLHGWLLRPIPWSAFPYIFPPTAFLAAVISKTFRDQPKEVGWLA